MTDTHYYHATDPMVVDWVELGCRGWEIDETGAWFVGPHPTEGPDHVHLDLDTLAILVGGDGAFLRRVYHDLAAAGIPGMVEWTITTYPRTATTNVVTAPSSAEWWVSCQ